MQALRSLWSRHKRKIFVSLGVLGGGYALYKLYDAHKLRTIDLEKELESQREVDELIKAQLQSHFENVQRVSDTVTLPYSMKYLRSRIAEDWDLSHLTEKLMQGKGLASPLSSKEKLEIWEKLKVLSFTSTAASLWSMTMLCLYVRVQVNILGRHLYLDIARGSESSHSQDEADSLSWHGHQDFLATADYLSTYRISTLLTNMQNAAMEILKEKQLKEPFSMDQLHETIVKILDLFMTAGEPSYWIRYLVPENAAAYRQLMAMSSNGFDDSSMDISKFEQLMLETRTVLSSPDFKDIVDISLRRVVGALVEDISMHVGGGLGPPPPLSSSGVPLAKLLPRVTQLGPPLLEEPSSNKYIHITAPTPPSASSIPSPVLVVEDCPMTSASTVSVDRKTSGKHKKTKKKVFTPYSAPATVSADPTTACGVDFSSSICRAQPVLAGAVVRGPDASGLGDEQLTHLSRDSLGLVSPIGLGQYGTDNVRPLPDVAACAVTEEAKALTAFQATLTDDLPHTSDILMGYDSSNEDGNYQLHNLDDSDLMIQALFDQGYSRGDIERRFGLLPQP